MKKYQNFSNEEYAKNSTQKLKENSLDSGIFYKNMIKNLEDILSILSDDQKLELRRKEYIENGK